MKKQRKKSTKPEIIKRSGHPAPKRFNLDAAISGYSEQDTDLGTELTIYINRYHPTFAVFSLYDVVQLEMVYDEKERAKTNRMIAKSLRASLARKPGKVR